jgi:plasmid stabilization system protein ParE
MLRLKCCGNDAPSGSTRGDEFDLSVHAAGDRRSGRYLVVYRGGQSEAANRVETEIVASCRRLARYPLMGSKRQDITSLPVRFWTVAKFPNYVIVYRPETAPIQVIAVLHGKRDLKEALQSRSV